MFKYLQKESNLVSERQEMCVPMSQRSQMERQIAKMPTRESEESTETQIDNSAATLSQL
jgi:hypothetical protein